MLWHQAAKKKTRPIFWELTQKQMQMNEMSQQDRSHCADDRHADVNTQPRSARRHREEKLELRVTVVINTRDVTKNCELKRNHCRNKYVLLQR